MLQPIEQITARCVLQRDKNIVVALECINEFDNVRVFAQPQDIDFSKHVRPFSWRKHGSLAYDLHCYLPAVFHHRFMDATVSPFGDWRASREKRLKPSAPHERQRNVELQLVARLHRAMLSDWLQELPNLMPNGVGQCEHLARVARFANSKRRRLAKFVVFHGGTMLAHDLSASSTVVTVEHAANLAATTASLRRIEKTMIEHCDVFRYGEQQRRIIVTAI